jgi:hypothetical protein
MRHFRFFPSLSHLVFLDFCFSFRLNSLDNFLLLKIVNMINVYETSYVFMGDSII